MSSNEPKNPDVAVVWSHIEYHNIPFGHLYQLEQVGIKDIYILLSEEELRQANEKKFIVFDHTEPQTVIGHYQSQSDQLKIHVINTGIASTEEEKLQFYRSHAPEQHLLNLFICKESLPWMNEELRARPPIIKITEYLSVPFFQSTKRTPLPLFNSPVSSEKAKELLQQELSPCFCYQMAPFDLLHYQWLLNIFVELITLNMTLSGCNQGESSKNLKKLIKAYNENIIEREKAEKSFEETHKEAYKTLDEPNAFLRWRHERNVKERSSAEENFPKLIKQLINSYSELVENKPNLSSTPP